MTTRRRGADSRPDGPGDGAADATGGRVGPVALVTGAGRGIGESVARRLAEAGYTVIATDLRTPDWPSGDARIVAGALDVTSPAAWEAALEELTATAGAPGRFDVLVNNAGVLYGGPFVEASFEEDSAVVDVNVKGVLYGCRAAYPYLRTAVGQGRPGVALVNVCSASALYGAPEMATYSATKFAVRGITEALDLEWAGEGIRVASAWPLYADTGMIAGVDTAGMRSMGVNLTADDVGRAVVALATEAARPTSVAGRLRSLVSPVVGRDVHRPVGRQATMLYLASQVTPGRVNRLIASRLSR